jgi:hypothetical protein
MTWPSSSNDTECRCRFVTAFMIIVPGWAGKSTPERYVNAERNIIRICSVPDIIRFCKGISICWTLALPFSVKARITLFVVEVVVCPRSGSIGLCARCCGGILRVRTGCSSTALQRSPQKYMVSVRCKLLEVRNCWWESWNQRLNNSRDQGAEECKGNI